jgi:hypothetical protein
VKLLQVGTVAVLASTLGTCTQSEPLPFGGTGGAAPNGGTTMSAGAPGIGGEGGDEPASGGTSTGAAGTGASGGTGGSGGASGGAPAGGGSTSNPTGPSWGPPGHVSLVLHRLGPNLLAYVPNRPGVAVLRGSGHTHAAPDHSNIEASAQEQRLRDLPKPHAHQFVWLTAHSFVAPDPQVSGILHMFGIEVYTATLPSGVAPHMLGYFRDGALADETTFPFGAFELDLNAAATAIREHGGLPALAHPARLPPSAQELAAVDERLWGMETTSGASQAEDALEMIDQRLTGGRYVCLTAGGDIHAEDDRLTRGYQLVAVDTATPDRNTVFSAVEACNLFACSVHDTSVTPLEPPTLRVLGDALELTLPRKAEIIRFVGRGGALLSEARNTSSARYAPRLQDLYVRVEAFDDSGRAGCYSQPIWLVDEATLASAP